MKKILAFSGSNSSTSINQQLVSFVASQIENCEVNLVNLAEYPLPIYGIDAENKDGFSEPLRAIFSLIQEADGIVISVNEHNGTVSTFFKNIIDWLSRIEHKFLNGKKLLLMSTSPGGRGGRSAYEFCNGLFPRLGAEIVAGFTFPSFGDNFSKENQSINNKELQEKVHNAISTFVKSLES